MKIRIIEVPPGEAPLEVRRGWVGLVLPLLPGEEGPQRTLAQGVISGPLRRDGVLRRLWYRLTGRMFVDEGYRVDVAAGLAELGKHDAHAESWWRTNAPHLLGPDCVFIFDPAVCEKLEG